MPTAATATLTGIVSTEGQCARCDRELGRVFTVLHADGTEATYGRRCCAKVTGWKPNQLDREATRLRRLAIITARRAAVTAAFPRFDINNGDGLTIVTNDRLWNDADGHTRGFCRWATWTEAITDITENAR